MVLFGGPSMIVSRTLKGRHFHRWHRVLPEVVEDIDAMIRLEDDGVDDGIDELLFLGIVLQDDVAVP